MPIAPASIRATTTSKASAPSSKSAPQNTKAKPPTSTPRTNLSRPFRLLLYHSSPSRLFCCYSQPFSAGFVGSPSWLVCCCRQSVLGWFCRQSVLGCRSPLLSLLFWLSLLYSCISVLSVVLFLPPFSSHQRGALGSCSRPLSFVVFNISLHSSLFILHYLVFSVFVQTLYMLS